MSLLYYSLRDEDSYQAFGSLLALECCKRADDMSLRKANSPVNSKNVQTYFNGDFLHNFLMYYEQKRNEDPDLVDMYQVFLGVFAMEYGVKIAKKDMKIMHSALIVANLAEDKKDVIREAFAEYWRTGSWAWFVMDDQGKWLIDD